MSAVGIFVGNPPDLAPNGLPAHFLVVEGDWGDWCDESAFFHGD
jgi:hypothetical protein